MSSSNGMKKKTRIFNALKQFWLHLTTLHFLSGCGRYLLDTDASGVEIGAILSQEIENEEKVIGYYSRALTEP